MLSKYNAEQYECNSIAGQAFGDVFCQQRNLKEMQFVKRVLLTSPTASEVMGPPPPAQGKPRSLNESFEGSADSLYQDSVVLDASDASDGTGSRKVKREGDGANKAIVADDPDKMEEVENSTSSTDEVDQVGLGEDEEDEEEQGSKRARVGLGSEEAHQERMEVKEELEFHAAAWRLEHLGSRGELQPVGREREAELPGDHATSVDSSGRHIMVEGIEI